MYSSKGIHCAVQVYMVAGEVQGYKGPEKVQVDDRNMRSTGVQEYRSSTGVHGYRSITVVHLYRRSTVAQM